MQPSAPALFVPLLMALWHEGDLSGSRKASGARPSKSHTAARALCGASKAPRVTPTSQLKGPVQCPLTNTSVYSGHQDYYIYVKLKKKKSTHGHTEAALNCSISLLLVVCVIWFSALNWIFVVSPIYLDFEFKKMLPPHTKNLLHHSHRCCTAVCSIYCSGCFQVRVINETFDGQREILRLKSNSEFSDFVDGTVVQPLHTPYSQLWLKKLH